MQTRCDCGFEFSVPRGLLGKRILCPACGHALMVPQPAGAKLSYGAAAGEPISAGTVSLIIFAAFGLSVAIVVCGAGAWLVTSFSAGRSTAHQTQLHVPPRDTRLAEGATRPPQSLPAQPERVRPPTRTDQSRIVAPSVAAPPNDRENAAGIPARGRGTASPTRDDTATGPSRRAPVTYGRDPEGRLVETHRRLIYHQLRHYDRVQASLQQSLDRKPVPNRLTHLQRLMESLDDQRQRAVGRLMPRYALTEEELAAIMAEGAQKNW